MNQKYITRLFGFSTFVGGIYYIRWAVIHAVEYRGLAPEYFKAILYAVIACMMFWLFKNRSKYTYKSSTFWIFTFWGLFTLYDFCFRIIPLAA